MKKKNGLGKGLDALFEDNSTDANSVTSLNLSDIEPNKTQPRKSFEETPLTELADSIREHGVLQPIIVRPLHNGRYQIVAGERRWRASRMAGLSEVPVIIKELSPAVTMELALIENLQREDLNPIEEAMGYHVLNTDHSMTQEQIAKRVGKSRPTVANALRLLKLPERVRDLVSYGTLSQGHARALLAFDEGDDYVTELAVKIIEDDLTVRDVEKMASKKLDFKVPREEGDWGNSYFKEMQIALSEVLGSKVTIQKKGNKNILAIEFYSDDELEAIAKLLSGQ